MKKIVNVGCSGNVRSCAKYINLYTSTCRTVLSTELLIRRSRIKKKKNCCTEQRSDPLYQTSTFCRSLASRDVDQDSTGHATLTGKGRTAFYKMRIAPYISTSKGGTKWKTRNIRPVFFLYGGYKSAMSHSKHILPYRNLIFISCTPSLVIRVSSPEIFIGISGLQEMLLSKLKLSLVYVYIVFFPLTQIQRQNAKYKCRVNLFKLSFQVGSMVYTDIWQQI